MFSFKREAICQLSDPPTFTTLIPKIPGHIHGHKHFFYSVAVYEKFLITIKRPLVASNFKLVLS